MSPVQSTLLVGIVGALLASFGNCVAYRLPRGMNWISGHSVCGKCGRKLTILELIPVISCVALRAHCAGCHTYFGWSNAITELALAIVAATIFYSSGCNVVGLSLALSACCVYCIIAVAVSYIRVRRIK